MSRRQLLAQMITDLKLKQRLAFSYQAFPDVIVSTSWGVMKIYFGQVWEYEIYFEISSAIWTESWILIPCKIQMLFNYLPFLCDMLISWHVLVSASEVILHSVGKSDIWWKKLVSYCSHDILHVAYFLFVIPYIYLF